MAVDWAFYPVRSRTRKKSKITRSLASVGTARRTPGDPSQRSAGENAQKDQNRRHLDGLRLDAGRQDTALKLLDRQEQNPGEGGCR